MLSVVVSVESLNLSKDWARAVVDVPVPASADINVVTEALHGVTAKAMKDDTLAELLLGEPALMGARSTRGDVWSPWGGGTRFQSTRCEKELP